ncbi:unnamed protein product [Polarella glacialis]|uniref:Uncharacterized protein n=1 Tax=Polarella glacialis TaxID=89957 RepID=A0A813DW09_POLGL|nr:unnamed protein product [Polarella glacialis]
MSRQAVDVWNMRFRASIWAFDIGRDLALQCLRCLDGSLWPVDLQEVLFNYGEWVRYVLLGGHLRGDRGDSKASGFRWQFSPFQELSPESLRHAARVRLAQPGPTGAQQPSSCDVSHVGLAHLSCFAPASWPGEAAAMAELAAKLLDLHRRGGVLKQGGFSLTHSLTQATWFCLSLFSILLLLLLVLLLWLVFCCCCWFCCLS